MTDGEPLEFLGSNSSKFHFKEIIFMAKAWGEKDAIRKLGKQPKARQNEAKISKKVIGME